MTAGKKRTHPLVGVWRSANDLVSSVEYRVRRKGNGFDVVAFDTYDREKADIFEQKWDAKKGELSFAALWNSTGRFLRCRMMSLGGGSQVAFTYSYSDSEVLVRGRSRKTGKDRR